MRKRRVMMKYYIDELFLFSKTYSDQINETFAKL